LQGLRSLLLSANIDNELSLAAGINAKHEQVNTLPYIGASVPRLQVHYVKCVHAKITLATKPRKNLVGEAHNLERFKYLAGPARL
jgi:hypothetical protein